MNKDLWLFIKECTKIIIIVLIIIFTLIIIIFKTNSFYFDSLYQAAINKKFNKLSQIELNKVVLIGGSNLAFGFNSEQAEKIIGRPVVNLGLHFGLNQEFIIKGSDEYYNSGDIVVIALEYDYYFSELNKGDIDLLMTSTTNYSISKPLRYYSLRDVLEYLPVYIAKKIDVRKVPIETIAAYGVYSNAAFNDAGDMIYNREKCILNLEQQGNKQLYFSSNIKDSKIKYLNDYIANLKTRNVKVLITFPVILKDTVADSIEQVELFQAELEERIKAPVISNISDYIFSKEYMYDTVYHCNSLGEKKRTEMLSKEILEYVTDSIK